MPSRRVGWQGGRVAQQLHRWRGRQAQRLTVPPIGDLRSRLLGLSRRLRIDRERGDEHECIDELLTAGSGERSDHRSTFEVDEPKAAAVLARIGVHGEDHRAG